MTDETIDDPLGLAKYVQTEERLRETIKAVGNDALAISSETTGIAETSRTLQDRIIALEADVTPQILRVSSELVSYLGNGRFQTDIALKCDDEERAKKDRCYNLNLAVKNGKLTAMIERVRGEGNQWYEDKAEIVIKPRKGKIGIAYQTFRNGYIIYENIGNNWGLASPTRTKNAKEAFRTFADDYIKLGTPAYITDFVRTEGKRPQNPAYIMAFVRDYARLPLKIADAVAKMKLEHTARHEFLERNAEEVVALAEGTR